MTVWRGILMPDQRGVEQRGVSGGGVPQGCTGGGGCKHRGVTQGGDFLLSLTT